MIPKPNPYVQVGRICQQPVNLFLVHKMIRGFFEHWLACFVQHDTLIGNEICRQDDWPMESSEVMDRVFLQLNSCMP